MVSTLEKGSLQLRSLKWNHLRLCGEFQPKNKWLEKETCREEKAVWGWRWIPGALRSWKRQNTSSSLEATVGSTALPTHWSWFWTFKIVTEHIFVVLSHQMCGDLSQKSQDNEEWLSPQVHSCNISTLHTQTTLGFFYRSTYRSFWKKARSWYLATVFAQEWLCTGNIMLFSSEWPRGEDEENVFSSQGTVKRHPHSLWSSSYW